MRLDRILFSELLSAQIFASFERAPSIIPFSMLDKYFASHFCPFRGPGSDRFPWYSYCHTFIQSTP